jgi:hypothetical protein
MCTRRNLTFHLLNYCPVDVNRGLPPLLFPEVHDHLLLSVMVMWPHRLSWASQVCPTDQFVAGFFTDLLHFLWNMKFVRTSSSVSWKDFLCLHEKPLSITVSMKSSQEFTTSDHSSLVVEAESGDGARCTRRATSWHSITLKWINLFFPQSTHTLLP